VFVRVPVVVDILLPACFAFCVTCVTCVSYKWNSCACYGWCETSNTPKEDPQPGAASSDDGSHLISEELFNVAGPTDLVHPKAQHNRKGQLIYAITLSVSIDLYFFDYILLYHVFVTAMGATGRGTAGRTLSNAKCSQSSS
jgi:hypothetical protein